MDSSIVCCDWRIVSRASASNRLYSTRARLPNGSAEKEGTGKLVRAPVGHFGGPPIRLVKCADMRYVRPIEFRPNDLASPRATRRTDDLLPKSRSQ